MSLPRLEFGCTAAGQPRSRRYYSYSDEKWNQMKGTIKSLYLDNNLPLPKLMGALAETHDFHPTMKMYKSRFERWGYSKNITEKRLRNAQSPSHRFPQRRLDKYLRRTRQGNPSRVGSDGTVSTTDSPCSDNLPQAAYSNAYEMNCPYKPFDKKFRFIEEFADGSVYSADSLGYGSYIDLDNVRRCSDRCLCRSHKHKLSSDYAFTIEKYPKQLDVTIRSNALLAEIQKCVPQEGLFTPRRSLNGLMLLRYHAILKNHLLKLVCVPPQDVALELRLLIDGFLGDSQIFRSFGYETLYEHGYLDYELWRLFQQKKLDSDIDDLDDAFGALEDINIPPTASHDNGYRHSTPGAEFNGSDHVGMRPDDYETHDSGEDPFDGSTIRENLSSGQGIATHTGLSPVKGVEAQTLVEAASLGNLQKVQSLVSQSSRFNISKAVAQAIKNNHPRVVQMLLNHGASVKNPNVLYRAARSGNRELVQMLLDHGADVKSPDVLYGAAYLGNRELVQMLLDYGADARGPDVLYGAVRSGNRELVQMLLDHGADARGPNVLYEAVSSGNRELVQMLLDHGADARGPNVLYRAARSGNRELVQILLDYGADARGPNVLYGATYSENRELVQMLLDHGADVKSPDVLYRAAYLGNRELVQMLLDHGADARDPGVLCGAARSGNRELVQMLLGGTITKQETRFLTAVSLAEIPEMLELLDGGIDVNVSSRCGSALSIAMYLENEELIRCLLKYGADVHLAALYFQTIDRTLSVRAFMRKIWRIQNGHITHTDHSLQQLRRKFVQQYQLMLGAGRLSQTKLQEICMWFRNYRHAWDVGISTMRRLSMGKAPIGVYDTVAFLCLSKAIAETLMELKNWDYNSTFNSDLPRWQLLFDDMADRQAYQDAVKLMWNVDLASIFNEDEPSPDILQSLGELARILVDRARDLLDLDLSNSDRLDQSQQRWRERNKKDQREPQDNPLSKNPLWPVLPPLTPSRAGDPGDLWKEEPPEAPLEPRVLCLVIGAIFAIIIIFFQVLRSQLSGCAVPIPFRRVNSLEERRDVLLEYLDIHKCDSRGFVGSLYSRIVLQ